MRVGLTVLNSFKGGGTEIRGGETKILKRRQAGSRGGFLKKGGGGMKPHYELKEGGWGRDDGLSGSVKKGKFVTKIFLSDVE